MPNSDPDPSLLPEEYFARLELRHCLSPILRQDWMAAVGSRARVVLSDPAPSSVPVCRPDTRASAGELDTGDAACAVDGSLAGWVVPWARSCPEVLRFLAPVGAGASFGKVSTSAGRLDGEITRAALLAGGVSDRGGQDERGADRPAL